MNRVDYLLTCVAEEAGEVVKECTKCLRFGIEDHHPKYPNGNNIQRLKNEFYDLLAMMEMLDEEVKTSMILDDPPESYDRKKERTAKQMELICSG